MFGGNISLRTKTPGGGLSKDTWIFSRRGLTFDSSFFLSKFLRSSSSFGAVESENTSNNSLPATASELERSSLARESTTSLRHTMNSDQPASFSSTTAVWTSPRCYDMYPLIFVQVNFIIGRKRNGVKIFYKRSGRVDNDLVTLPIGYSQNIGRISAL